MYWRLVTAESGKRKNKCSKSPCFRLAFMFTGAEVGLIIDGEEEGSEVGVTSTNTALVVFLMERPKSLASRTRNSPLSMDRCNFFITSTGFKMHVTLTVISRLTGDIALSDDVSMEVNTLLVSVSVLVFTDGLLLRVSSLMVEVACMSRTEEMA